MARRAQAVRAAVAELWNLITLPTLNLPASQGSLALATMVFRTGLLDAADACDIGVPAVPLQQLHGDAAATALERAGVRVAPSTPVRRAEGRRVVLEDEAASPTPSSSRSRTRASPGSFRPSAVDADALQGLGSSPIVNLHVHFDRRVLDEPFAAAEAASPLQWLFDRTQPSEVARGPTGLGLALRGRGRHRRAARHAARALPPRARSGCYPPRAAPKCSTSRRRASRARRSAPSREPRACAPAPRTGVEGLYLAGAWTDTGWPATMESAVRSGLAAARAALSDLAQGPAHDVAEAVA